MSSVMLDFLSEVRYLAKQFKTYTMNNALTDDRILSTVRAKMLESALIGSCKCTVVFSSGCLDDWREREYILDLIKASFKDIRVDEVWSDGYAHCYSIDFNEKRDNEV